ncbi:hypothetical protein GJ744_011761 [Endocarpon pusillum]|uniref:Heterokaryon incompatibility domain-containing protein n=1 Tax=Endocarpon pusillum TaxID=364733 RepID=A0A8H7AG53_9EURO|nr:hypothetical protein GJ744_011761 [Endocarpon pusillum]
MDHLTWRNDLGRPRPTVPYLLDDESSICNELNQLSAWPALMGWDLDPNLPLLESARRCQAWLFFGFVRIWSDLVGQPFIIDHFIKDSDYGRLVNSSYLRKISSSARQRLLRSGSLSDTGETLLVELIQTLHISRNWIMRLSYRCDESGTTCNPWNCDFCSVFLSTLLLFDYFCETLAGGLEGASYEVETAQSLIPLYQKFSSSLSEGLRLMGRCPTVVERIKLSSLDTYRLLAIPVCKAYSHPDCHDRYCSAFNIDSDTYVIQHTTSCGNRACSVMRIDRTRLHELVRNDRLPLIHSKLTSNGVLMIEIIDGTSMTNYTAISHVWAGGLGNFQDNALYSCQLYGIHRNLSNPCVLDHIRTSQSTYYWLDSLCIPVHDGSLKVQAINTMSRIYAGAKCVLVIDPELRDLKATDLEPKEIDLALLCSPWMARSWTLQEGALGIDIKLKFADTVFSYERLDSKHSHCRRTSIQGLWKREVDQVEPKPMSKLFAFDHCWDFLVDTRLMPRHEKFIRAWNELCHRSSTKPEDIAAILATFIDCNAGEVLQLASHQRMHALLKTQSILPTSILFVPVESSSREWCPKFPMSKDDFNMLSPDMGTLELTDSFHFRLTEIHCVELLYCHHPILLCGEIGLHDTRGCWSYYIKFADWKSKLQGKTVVNVLFLFQSPIIAKRGPCHGTGICFIALRDDDEGLHVEFAKTFQWKRARPLQSHSDSPAPDNTGVIHAAELLANCQHLPGASGLDYFDKSRCFRVVSPVSSSDIHSGHPLIIDMDKCSAADESKFTLILPPGMTDWPSLTWSRSKFFPFMETSVQLAQALYMFMPLALLMCFLNVQMTMVYALEAGLLVGPKACIEIILSGVFVVLIRLYLANLEYKHIHRTVNKQLQRKWALSYYTSEPTERAGRVNRLLPTNGMETILICSIYAIFVITAVVFMVKDSIFAISCLYPKIYGYIGSTLIGLISILFINLCEDGRKAFPMFEQFFKSIFFEFLLRVAVIAASWVRSRWLNGPPDSSTPADQRERRDSER